MKTYTQYGWPVSPYSAKTRACFVYKQLPFREIHPTARQLLGPIRKAVGRPIMPTVRTLDGHWLQDTSDIIDYLEETHPRRPVVPTTPKQKIVSSLFELHGDEWLIIPALHYRWNLKKNASFARKQFGKYGLKAPIPGLRRLISKKIAAPMSGYLPIMGIQGNVIAGVEQYIKQWIELLDVHLTAVPFLLGDKPCMGDFALYGPLWAHLYRDPASRSLFDNAPAVRAWFDRLEKGTHNKGSYLPDDHIPKSLNPLIKLILGEQIEYLAKLVDAANSYGDAHPTQHRLPRALGETNFSFGGQAGKRKLITYGQWMLQRPLDLIASLSIEDHKAVEKWLHNLGGRTLLSIDIRYPLRRENFREVLDR